MKLRSIRQVVLIPVLITFAVGFTMFAVYADRTERNSRLADLDQELQRAQAGSGLFDRPRGRPAAPTQLAAEGEATEPPLAQPGPAGDVAGPPLAQPGPAGDATGPPLGQPGPALETEVVAADPLAPVTLVSTLDGLVLDATGAANPFSDAELEQILSVEGYSTLGEFRVLTTERAGEVFVTALSLEAATAAASDFRQALLIGGALIFVLVGSALWVLTSRLVRPVRDMADSVSKIAAGDLDVAIQAGGSHEMVNLASDIDQMVTTLKRTIGESQRNAAEATTARSTMQRLLADLAHEVRTPLTALKGYSDLYANGMLDPDGGLDRAMERVGSESDRLHRMAADMLQIARGQEVESAPEVVDMCAIVERVGADLQAAFPELRVETAMTPATGQWVRGLPGQLHQAILNVGSNACQHSAEDDTVLIAVDAQEQNTVITIIDHGPGIAKADRARVFTPFYRADASRSRSGNSGAGLGLALVRSIVDGHAGTITVHETPGGGTTILLALPTHQPAENS